MSLRCVYCGAEGALRHHLTGRDAQLRYLDPRLTLPLCHDCHQLVHDDLRTLDVDDPQDRAIEEQPLVELVELRLRRLAVALGRIADALPDFTWLARLAETAKWWADHLRRDVTARDARDPGWRQDQRFYAAA